MASISIYSTTSSSVTLYLTSLDTSWAGGTRTVNWYLGRAGGTMPTTSSYYKSNTGNSLANGVSTSGTVTFSGLSANTMYGVLCEVYHGSTKLATLTGYATTKYEELEPTWELYPYTLGSISALESVSISLSKYSLYRYRVSFANSGTAKFYTEGTSADTYGFLSTSTGWDSEDGEPSSYIASDDDAGSGNNFEISYNVTAGTTYYIWVRGYSSSTTGKTTLYIEPPSQSWTVSSGGSLGKISDATSVSFSLSTKQVKRYSVTFENSGEAIFYTSSSADTYGYLSTSSSFDSTNGEPSSYIASGDDAGSGNNFEISYNVTAGTTYYIWVRQYSGSSTGTIDLYIEPPEAAAVRPSNFSWTYTKTKGGSFNLTATEWNNLTARINAFRVYRGLSNYSFTRAYSGNDFTAAMYNQAVNAIKGISGYGSYLYTVSKGDTVTAAGLNALRDELNAIP